MNESSGKGAVVCVFPHSDDLSIFAGGLVAALTADGRECYLIRVTDDDKDSWALSPGETTRRIESETTDAAEIMGLKGEFRLGYPNHYLDETMVVSLRHRLITLFRHLRAEIVVSFDPWALYEENPDHRITGLAADQACWMSERLSDLPELSMIGIMPCQIRTRVYVGRGVQQRNYHFHANRTISTKHAAILCHETPLTNMILIDRIGSANDLAAATAAADGIGDEDRRMYVADQLLASRCCDCPADVYCEPYYVIGDMGRLPNE